MSFNNSVSKIAIIIPAFNEENSIATVVSQVSAYGTPIVVNDGSTDNTQLVANASGAIVVSHSVNRGYDIAISTGLQRAVRERFDFAITIDADGQHDPCLIKSFFIEFTRGADLVIGIRDRCQRISERIFAMTSKVIWGISDPLCGMKGYRLSRLRCLDTFLHLPSIGTELLSELFALAG